MPDFNPGPAVTSTSNQIPALTPTSAATTALYVTTDGNDNNSGSLNAPFATIQAAINALPVNGGLVEVGYGSFAGFVIVGTAGVHVRGRGIGRGISGDGTVTAEAHPTTITSNIIVASATGNSGKESNWATSFLLEDCAVVNGSASSWNGVGCIISTPYAQFRRVSFDSCVSHGVMSAALAQFTVGPTGTSGTLTLPWGGTTDSYTLLFSDGEIKTSVTLTNNSTAVSWTGALTGTPTINVMAFKGVGFLVNNTSWFLNFEKCQFTNNGGCAYMGMAQVTGFYDCHIENNSSAGSGNPATPFTGVGSNGSALDFYTLGASQEVSFYNCVIQRQHASGAAVFQGSALQFVSCHIENNVNASRGEIFVYAGVLTCSGCLFVPGPSTAAFGIFMNPTPYQCRIVGCNITGGNNWTTAFINTAVNGIAAGISYGIRYNQVINGAIDGAAITAGNIIGGVNVSNPALRTIGTGIFLCGLVESVNQQVLSANGAVTFDASLGGVQIALLAANATSSSITNPSPGQTLTIQWEQDNTGSRTYVWPTNCKFAANAAPSASSAANLADIVTFKCFWTGTNYYWREIARAAGVPAPAV